MLAIFGGRERTASRFDEPYRSTGFIKGTVIETAGALRLVETRAA